MKKSKVVALLAVCVMMFGVVEPSFARTWGEVGQDTAEGAVVAGAAGGVLGAVGGAILMGAAVFLSGGALLPALPVIGGVALTGATYGSAAGAIGGAMAGAVGGKQAVKEYVDDMGHNVAEGVAGQIAGNVTEQYMRKSGSTEQQITDYRNSVKNTPLEYESWHNNQ